MCSPVLVLPTLVLVDFNECAKAQFTLLDFDTLLLALAVLATGTIVGTDLYHLWISFRSTDSADDWEHLINQLIDI